MDETSGSWRRALRYGVPVLVSNLVLAVSSPAWAETVTVAALGDSLTAGYGLPDGDGFVPELQAWLTARGADVEIVNAGVSGDTTAGGLSRVDWTLTPEVDAMIVELGGNDLLRGIDPAVSRENLSGILAAGREAGVEILLVGLRAGGNYGPEYQGDFNAMYSELAAEYDVSLFADFFAPLTADGDADAARDRFMQADGIHPNAEGVDVVVAAIGPVVLDLIGSVD